MFIAENEGDQIKKKERKTWNKMNKERERAIGWRMWRRVWKKEKAKWITREETAKRRRSEEKEEDRCEYREGGEAKKEV